MIECPHCGYGMEIRSVRVGTFHPACTSCGKRFSLTVATAVEEVEEVETPSAREGRRIADAEVHRPARATSAPEPAARAERPTMHPGTIPLGGDRDKHHPEIETLRPPPTVKYTAAPVAAVAAAPMTGRLGGYDLKRKLGQGGMGSVYLARQVSLDRDVAVKVLAPDLARDAIFVSRFVREAYAAAQLVHHNVVQIHDIGEQEQTHFYSMEFVPGQSLANLIQREGAIAADTAAGYILQAARGLQLAHDQGMIHRDIKPENLLLSQNGIVKVADLGLVKHKGEETAAGPTHGKDQDQSGTLAHSTMGTPAYMAPEQAKDASSVDARADIYSLGCTFYALLTGQAPYQGATAQEILSRVAVQDVPDVRRLNQGVPAELDRIVRKMTARKRDARYANIAQVIRDLDAYLGVEEAGKFTARQQHVDTLVACAKEFNESPVALFRRLMINTFLAGGVLLSILLAWNGSWFAAAGTAALVVLTTVFYQVMAGLFGQSELLRYVRLFVFASRWRDWLRWTIMVLLGCLAILAVGMLGTALAVTGMAVLLAALFQLTLDRQVTAQRRSAMTRLEAMLRDFRLKGMEEENLRRFVCEYSGKHWEEIFETLFGYEAKLDARKRWGRSVRGYDRPKYAAWRDPILHNLKSREEAHRLERERKHLLRIEARSLEAQGVDEVAAAKQARRIAEQMVAQGLELREKGAKKAAAATLPPHAHDQEAAPEAEHVQKAREAFDFSGNESTRKFQHLGYVSRRYGGPLEVLFGPRARFVMATVVLLGFLLWRYDNRGAIVSEIEQLQGHRLDADKQDISHAIQTVKEVTTFTARPLRLTGVPDAWCNIWGSWNAGLAGAILLASSFSRNRRLALPVLPASAIILMGQYLPLIQSLPGDPNKTAMLIGAAIAGLGFAFARGES